MNTGYRLRPPFRLKREAIFVVFWVYKERKLLYNYNSQTKEATVFVTKPSRYSLIFADYENESLKNVDIVEYDFAEGINTVVQEVTSFALASGDKVMLWYDMINLVPVCEALTIK